MSADLEIIHETRYDYAAPVSQAYHLAHLQPLDDARQTLLAFNLSVEPAPVSRHDRHDNFGNACQHFSLGVLHGELLVRSHSCVRVGHCVGALDAGAGPPWEAERDRLRYVAGARYDPAVEFVQPSPYVPRLEALRAYGRASFPAGRPLAEGAIDLMHRVHADFEYRSQSTQVDTPVEQAFEQRTGVCQDFSHVMIGALRMLGLPARYVSGYLLTRPRPGEPALVGADASHAWVQVYVPGTPGAPLGDWLDLDPTNDLVPASDHVRVAVGRDFGDVTPLRGVIRGGGRHTLTVAVTTRLLGATGSAGPVVA